jgi:hypothetical protein
VTETIMTDDAPLFDTRQERTDTPHAPAVYALHGMPLWWIKARSWLRARMLLWSILCGASVLVPFYASAWAQIVRYQGPDGRVYFTHLPLSPVPPTPQLDNTGATPEEVPLLNTGGVYTLPVAINGVLTPRFILDTG